MEFIASCSRPVVFRARAPHKYTRFTQGVTSHTSKNTQRVITYTSKRSRFKLGKIPRFLSELWQTAHEHDSHCSLFPALFLDNSRSHPRLLSVLLQTKFALVSSILTTLCYLYENSKTLLLSSPFVQFSVTGKALAFRSVLWGWSFGPAHWTVQGCSCYSFVESW